MPSFGKASQERLNTCHPDIQRLMNEAIKYVDFSITCGYRNQTDQDAAFAAGNSKLKYPNGEHNKNPSRAVDVSPYPTNWNDSEAFTLLSGYILGIASMMGIKIRLGADWDGDFSILEHSFKDRPHVELM